MKKVVILLSSKQGGGKTDTSRWILGQLRTGDVGALVIKFADPLYEMHDSIKKILEPYGYQPKVKWGSLLQYLGTDFGRKELDENIWLKIAGKRCSDFFDRSSGSAYWMKSAIVIFDDLRFKNEWSISDYFGPDHDVEVFRIRLACPEEIRRERCENWRENATHQSEIDLDDWIDRFDLVVDTSKEKNECRDQILEFLIKHKVIETAFKAL